MKLIFRIKTENINRIIGKSSDNNKQKIYLHKSDHNIQKILFQNITNMIFLNKF